MKDNLIDIANVNKDVMLPRLGTMEVIGLVDALEKWGARAGWTPEATHQLKVHILTRAGWLEDEYARVTSELGDALVAMELNIPLDPPSRWN